MGKIEHVSKTYGDFQKKLDLHLQKKLANTPWFRSCLDQNFADFPYRICNSGEGKILNRFYYPRNQNQTNPTLNKRSTPCFIVNIPEGKSPSLAPSDSRYSAILKQLKTESFSTAPATSDRMFSSRVAVVIGTNQVKSLDPAINRTFVKLIQNTSAATNMACRRFGFLWRPEPEYDQLIENRYLYSAKDSFLLLKAYSDVDAEKVRKFVEESENKLHPDVIAQIPFQKIRQTILKSGLTRNFVDLFQKSAPHSPLYLTVMDADFLSLRIGRGIFTKVSEAISLDPLLSVVGCAYSAAKQELPIIQLALRIDMAVRAAMTRHIPYSAYLPEPFLCVLLRKPNKNHHLDRLSFLGNGRSLESRRLIENGKAAGVLNNHMTFIPDGIVTTSPNRWKTQKNQSYPTLTRADVKQKRVLQALRGISQSHAHPKKWADQVYAAIDFSCPRVTNATTPMMRIFSLFDPISKMFAPPGQGRFTAKAFDQEIRSYSESLTDVQINILELSKQKLRDQGMSSDLIKQIVNAAKASGKAIWKELHHTTTT